VEKFLQQTPWGPALRAKRHISPLIIKKDGNGTAIEITALRPAVMNTPTWPGAKQNRRKLGYPIGNRPGERH